MTRARQVAPGAKVATLNFRVSNHVARMLRQLAAEADLSMTAYIETFVRASFKRRFPDRAREYETAAERFERQLLRPSKGRP